MVKSSLAERAEGAIRRPLHPHVTKPPFFSCLRELLRATKPCSEHCEGPEHARHGGSPRSPATVGTQGFALFRCAPGCRHPHPSCSSAEGSSRCLQPVPVPIAAPQACKWQGGAGSACSAAWPGDSVSPGSHRPQAPWDGDCLALQFVSSPDSKQIHKSLILII